MDIRVPAYHARLAELRQQLGSKCVQCGETWNLHFDHVDPTTKVSQITDMVFESLSNKPGMRGGKNGTEEAIAIEMTKVQLLCIACHTRKTVVQQGREAKHGTKSKYNAGCRCRECKDATAQYQRSRLARKRVQWNPLAAD
jgi:5-methylcytosine-specific restriction endonuclease McrA